MATDWTTPKSDYLTGDLVSAAEMNNIGKNLGFLKDPPTAQYTLNEGSDYTTTSTSFVDVDGGGTELELTIETAGGDVLIGFVGAIGMGTNKDIYLDIDVDGARLGGSDGIAQAHDRVGTGSGTGIFPIGLCVLVENLTPGSHTFKLQWRVSAGTGTLYAVNSYGRFFAREVS